MPFMRKIPPELEFAGIFFGQKMCAPGWQRARGVRARCQEQWCGYRIKRCRTDGLPVQSIMRQRL